MPRPYKLSLLNWLGLNQADAKRTLMLAEAAEPQPVPYSPLVGGYAHPESLVVHRKGEDGSFVCGTPMRAACFSVSASDVKRIEGLRGCERCYKGTEP